MRDLSLAHRLALAALVWLIAGGAVGAYALELAFATAVRDRFDVKLEAVARGVAAAVVRTETEVGLRPIGEPSFDRPRSGWYWVILERDRVLGRSPSLGTSDVGREADGDDGLWRSVSAPQPVALDGPFGERLRAVAAPITAGLPGLRVVVAIETSEIDEEIRSFGRLLLLSVLGFVAVLALAILAQIRVGLAPLRHLRTDLGRLVAGTADRIDRRYPLEIRPLVDTINRVLDKEHRVVEQSRRMAGNLAHVVKTELAVLRTLQRSDDAFDFETGIDRIARIVEHHASRAASSGFVRTHHRPVAVGPVLDDVRAALERIHVDRGITVDLVVRADPCFRGARQDFEEIAGNLIENAFKHARARVSIVAEEAEATLTLLVEDDGAGLSPEEIAVVGAPGVRLDQSIPGHGLGLSIVKDLVEAYGGTIGFGRSPLGGLAVRLSLPRAFSDQLGSLHARADRKRP